MDLTHRTNRFTSSPPRCLCPPLARRGAWSWLTPALRLFLRNHHITVLLGKHHLLTTVTINIGDP